VMWSNRGAAMWQAGAEVASCCAAMCELGFDSLLMWVVVAVPCGMGWVRWTTGWLPRGTVVGPTCQVTCARVGPTC
jgi:hypothetical protein